MWYSEGEGRRVKLVLRFHVHRESGSREEIAICVYIYIGIFCLNKKSSSVIHFFVYENLCVDKDLKTLQQVNDSDITTSNEVREACKRWSDLATSSERKMAAEWSAPPRLVTSSHC